MTKSLADALTTVDIDALDTVGGGRARSGYVKDCIPNWGCTEVRWSPRGTRVRSEGRNAWGGRVVIRENWR